MSRSTILIVEDEAIVAADLAAKLDHLGYEVIGSTARGEDAIAIARDKQPDIILMDIQLQGGMDGVEAATAIYRNFGLPFVYLTAHSDTATIERAKITESFGYILKPFEEREVGIAIEMALYKHQAEERLRESEERCRALADASFDGVVVLEQSKVIDINSRGLAMLRWTREEMLGKDVVDVIGAELGTAATQQLNLGSEECHEGSLTRRDGSHLCIELRVRSAHFQGRPVHLASIRDVTESKRAQAARMKLEAQLRQSQKIQALGTLAGGIAHDFNNILTMILGNAELARMELPSDHEAREMLLQVLKAGYRARDLVDQILTFSRPREQLHAVVQLGPIIVDALNLLRASLPSTIQIHAEQPSREHGVLGDPVQIQQVLINVGNNAGHAMKATGGVLNFRQSLVQVEKNQFDVIPELAPGWYIRLDISDTGCGMDQATLERIFEPFFTTRPPGEGTGLGLAVTLGILQNHGGGISVHSEPGQGTTFGLYLRADVRAVTDPPASPAPSVGDKKGRGERVVVIDDEPDIAVLAGQILKRGGYAARVYTNPREALADLQAAPQSCDLVLTDLTMPGMTGMEVAKELRKIRPNLPIVLCTGFGHDLDASALNEAGIRAKLTKPFSVKALYELLNRLLSV